MWLILLVNLAGKIAALCVARAAPWPALGLWFLPESLFWYHIFVPRAQGVVRAHRRFAPVRPEVWLTIDDGPDPADTPRILELLAAHGARATFFVVGERVAAHPELVRAMVAEGHEVAHHTHTHPLGSFWFASPARLRRELDAALAALAAVGVRPARFRPPGGFKNPWLARALAVRGLVCVGWSGRGLEVRSVDPAAVAARVMHGMTAGSILLMHEGPPVPPAIRVAGIRCVLERLRAQGFRCVIPAPSQLR